MDNKQSIDLGLVIVSNLAMYPKWISCLWFDLGFFMPLFTGEIDQNRILNLLPFYWLGYVVVVCTREFKIILYLVVWRLKNSILDSENLGPGEKMRVDLESGERAIWAL